MSTLQRPKAKLAAAIAISMALTTLRVFPAMIDSAAAAEVCRGPAAYPPDLPGCLDPVGIAQQAAAAAAARMLLIIIRGWYTFYSISLLKKSNKTL